MKTKISFISILLSLISAGLCFSSGLCFAEVKLPSIISSNMVLQRNTDVALWGWTQAGRKVTVSPSWTKTKYTAVSDADGKFMLKVPTPDAGGPYQLVFNDGDKTVLDNILIGEVWFCSGQSNMHMPMGGFPCQPVEGSARVIATASPERPIRMCTVGRVVSASPLDTCTGVWQTNLPEVVSATSATAYFFADMLQEALKVPVGLLITNYSGSSIQSWMDRATIDAAFKGEFDMTSLDKGDVPKNAINRPCYLFYGQVAPLIPFTFKGMIWYQGCNNRYNPEQYKRLQPAYVAMMRERFNNPDAPFYFVQLAPYKYNDPEHFTQGYMCEAQQATLDLIPNSGMAVTVDLGQKDCIHPAAKRQVGERLALMALQDTYKLEGIDTHVPRYESMSVKGEGRVYVSFTKGSRGFAPMYVKLDGFEMAGEDRVFHPAKGEVIDRNTISVTCDEVPAPVAVRYCFRNWSVGTVHNLFGLPLAPFRTDSWSDLKK